MYSLLMIVSRNKEEEEDDNYHSYAPYDYYDGYYNAYKPKERYQEVMHYPSQSEIRKKLANLEKSRWFRFKRSVANVFGIDITSKYSRPRKIRKKIPIYAPSYQKDDSVEYNNVAKLFKRSNTIEAFD